VYDYIYYIHTYILYIQSKPSTFESIYSYYPNIEERSRILAQLLKGIGIRHLTLNLHSVRYSSNNFLDYGFHTWLI
jgi:hypothetical protein